MARKPLPRHAPPAGAVIPPLPRIVRRKAAGAAPAEAGVGRRGAEGGGAEEAANHIAVTPDTPEFLQRKRRRRLNRLNRRRRGRGTVLTREAR